MINPSEVGKSGEMVRLRTLESVWIQGKLRMWGRWSYIGGGSGGNMFNQLLASGKITKTAINDALRRMKKSGISKPELEAFFQEILNGKNKSGLAFCTDEEALTINSVLGEILVRSVDWPLYFQTLFIALPITGSPPQIFPWRTISQCTVRMPFVVMFEGLRKVLCRC
ncbi:DUF1133 family protein [Klebsiella michiganensis]|uniref:DUF1133 family protein n=1 Tax=Klebsiella michiganensis TaxID=1134687 RepID=UPI001E472296|nr:DUF1133 family protein [Klebsiella michiganensis]